MTFIKIYTISYQKYWNVVGSSLINIVQDCFRHGLLPRFLNKTLIVLVPKCLNASNFSQLRPISLCNVAYKVISKFLLPDCVLIFTGLFLQTNQPLFRADGLEKTLSYSKKFCIL